jgi:hypothetical protein
MVGADTRRRHRLLPLILGLVVAAGAILVFYGVVLILLQGPQPTGVTWITSDFPLASGGPTNTAFDAVQSNHYRFGASSTTRDFIASLHAGASTGDIQCFIVSVTLDGSPATYLLQVQGDRKVSVSAQNPRGWQANGSERATRCEVFEPPPGQLPASSWSRLPSARPALRVA